MSEVADTGSGFIVGAEPAQPRRAADWANTGTPAQQVSQPVQVVDQQPRPAYRWTDEDMALARQQEKDKLYGRIEDLGTQLRSMQDERAAEKAERDRLATEAAEATRLREEGEMDVRQLLEKREAEWRDEIGKLTARYDADREIFNKERQLQEVENYRRDRIEQEQDHILPELRDFVTGSTIEQVDASIEVMKERTSVIFANFMQAERHQPFQPRLGATPTAPPVGPMEQIPAQEPLTPDMIRNMDMDTYKRMRPHLLQAANPRYGRGG